MERFVSIMVEGTWTTCVYGLVVSEGGRRGGRREGAADEVDLPDL
jgi:hypothetical protein